MAASSAIIMAMKTANIAELKDSLAKFIAEVEAGEEVEIRRRNLPVARLVPISARKRNETVLGCGRGSVRILGELTEPMIPEGDWETIG
jgi:prevent-host-death family protein